VSPVTHLLASWVIAAKTTDNPRDCRLVTLAGVLPDLDGLGIVVDIIKNLRGQGTPHFYYYARYHHYLLHGAFGAIVISALLAAFAQKRLRVALLSLLVFHLHLLCDLAGSRGPAPEDLWPIFYFGPFDKDPMWIWKGQWPLDSWRNRLLTVTLFFWSLWLAVPLGHSFVGVFNRKADQIFVTVLRKWKSSLISNEQRGVPHR
jgi:hypothetical protein